MYRTWSDTNFSSFATTWQNFVRNEIGVLEIFVAALRDVKLVLGVYNDTDKLRVKMFF